MESIASQKGSNLQNAPNPPLLQKRGRGNPNWIKNGVSPIYQGMADPGRRRVVLLEKYGIKKILKFAKDLEKAPLTAQDGQLVMQIARSFYDGQELERFENRAYGKVPDKSINLNVNLDGTAEELGQRAQALLDRIKIE